MLHEVVVLMYGIFIFSFPSPGLLILDWAMALILLYVLNSSCHNFIVVMDGVK
jgi:hypothetical protein